MIFQVAFQILITIPEIFAFTKASNLMSIVLYILLCYYYIPNLAFINFTFNFKKFIAIIIKQARSRLQLRKFNELSTKVAIRELEYASKTTNYFRNTFNLQLTMVFIVNATSVVIGVRYLEAKFSIN